MRVAADPSVNFNYANRTTSPIMLYTSLIQQREQTVYEEEEQLKLLHMGRHYKVEFSLMQETLICVAADNTARYHVYRFGQFLWFEAVSPYLLNTEMKPGLQLITNHEHIPAANRTDLLTRLGRCVCLSVLFYACSSHVT